MQHGISLNILLVHPAHTTPRRNPRSRVATVCCALYRFDHSDLFLLQDLQFRHIHSDGTVEDAMKSEHLHETIEWCPQWKKKRSDMQSDI